MNAHPEDPFAYHGAAANALAKCAAYDPWFPQPNSATVDAWAEQIAHYRLEEADVLAGVTVAYRDNGSGFRPLPRDIVQAALAIRRDRQNRETTAERRAREDARDAALEPGAQSPEPENRTRHLERGCPNCGAVPGTSCRRPTGEPRPMPCIARIRLASDNVTAQESA